VVITRTKIARAQKGVGGVGGHSGIIVESQEGKNEVEGKKSNTHAPLKRWGDFTGKSTKLKG